MSIYNPTPLATVSEIIGKAWVQAEDGTRHLLHSGEKVYEGQVIITEDGAIVELKAANGAALKVAEGRELVLGSGLFANQREAFTVDSAENTLNLDLTGAMAANESAGNIISTDHAHATIPKPVSSDIGMQTGHGFVRAERILDEITNPPYRYLSFTGSYVSLFVGRNEANDVFLTGRATIDERIEMTVEPLAFTYEEAGYELMEFRGTSEERSPNRIPKALDDHAVVV